jgi:YVTN family beta-propeller protein
MMKNIKFWAMLCALITLFVACDPDEPIVEVSPYESGVFIAHQGAFGSGTGTVSFYNRTVGGVKNDIFGTANGGAAIGNVLQSVTVIGDKAYLAVNNANKIVVVDAKTFKFQDSISGTILPRYMIDIDDKKAFLSEWGTGGLKGAVRVYDKATKKFTKTIATGNGAERMLKASGGIYVTNVGGFDSDSTVALIDVNSETVVSKIKVGVNPNSLVQDANNDIWVLCGGDFGAPNGKLVQLKNNVIAASFNVPQGSNSLVINSAKNVLYFATDKGIYQKDLTTTAPSVFIGKPAATASFGALYGLGIDPKTGNLFCADAKDYASKGVIYIFNNAKVLQDSLKTDIIPADFWFK